MGIKKIISILLAVSLLGVTGCTAPVQVPNTTHTQTEEQTAAATDAAEERKDNMTMEAAKTLKGKVIAGYQGWFGTDSDGYNERGWMHWSGRKPAMDNEGKQKVSFEMFPSLGEYTPQSLADIDFPALPDGRKAQLFSSYIYDTVDLHFKWMRDYGIDGVALQRFLGEATSGRSEHFDTVARHVKRAAEKYGRVFYVCYDLSGYKNDDYVDAIIADFKTMVVKYNGLLDSPNYLREGGKPVVQLWGMGVNGNYKRSPEESLEIIRFFREQGCYVIGGVPTDWRKDSGDGIKGFAGVYAEFDMISPWTVGRFGTPSEVVNHYKTKILPDMEQCVSDGKDYMPVIFAGFAWSLWNGGKPNQIARRAGELMRTQMEQALRYKPYAVYIAMFDEYDEGTAIMKAASDSSQIPSGSYFLTTSADGVFVSDDYYLRLAGEFTRQFRGEPNADIGAVPLTAGPVWFRTSFEKGMDAVVKPDLAAMGLKASVEQTSEAHTGKYVLGVECQPGSSDSTGVLQQFNTPISDGVTLTYWVKGSGLALCCVMVDGSIVTAPSGTDGEWSKITLDIGAGQASGGIAALAVTAAAGTAGLIDDIALENAAK